ncbi:MAG: hypothetical protein AAGA27_02645 [Pseudomonadota bacterium]
MKKLLPLFAASAALLFIIISFTGCSGRQTLTITVTPSLSASTVSQDSSTLLTFTANQALTESATFTVRSSTLMHLRNTPRSCTIAADGKSCTITIPIDAAENPVTHTLHFSVTHQGINVININPTSLPLIVQGLLALSITDPTDGVNQGPGAEDITVTNNSTTESASLDTPGIIDVTSDNNLKVDASSGFEIYGINGVIGTGKWCNQNSTQSNCNTTSCFVNDTTRTLSPGESCLIHIRAKEYTGMAVGTPLKAYLTISANNDTSSTMIMMENTPMLYAGGRFTSASGQQVNYIARWNGTSWSGLSSDGQTGVNGIVYALATDALGDLFVGGSFTTVGNSTGGQTVNYIAKWNHKGWSALSSGGQTGVNLTVRALTTDASGNLFVGGQFTTIGNGTGGETANYIAKWNDNGWSTLTSNGQNGVNSLVRALTTDASGNLLVGGGFTTVGNGTGGQTVNYIAKWNENGWSSLTSGEQTGVNSSVYALTTDAANNLFVGGFFTTIGNSTGGPTANFIAKWSDNSWHTLTSNGQTGVNNPVRVLTTDTSGNLFLGGSFTTIGNGTGGQTANYIAKWNDNGWFNLTSNGQNGVNSPLLALITDASNNLFVGGDFTTIGNGTGGQTFNYIAKLTKWDNNNNNNASWSPPWISGGQTGVDDRVYALAIVNTYNDSLS